MVVRVKLDDTACHHRVLFYLTGYTKPQLGILGPSTLSNAVIINPLESLIALPAEQILVLPFLHLPLHPLNQLLTLEVGVCNIFAGPCI